MYIVLTIGSAEPRIYGRQTPIRDGLVRQVKVRKVVQWQARPRDRNLMILEGV